VNGYHLVQSQHNEIWVLGNGESRKSVDLSKLPRPIIGCNAVHRDFVCDYIVAVDKRMVDEILSNPLYNSINIYTRSNWVPYFRSNQVRQVPSIPYHGTSKADDPWHWNSGPFAVLLASNLNIKKINLLGFDLYGKDQRVNNIYKDTKNYSNSSKLPVDHSHWVHQLPKIFQSYPDKEYIQWNTKDWRIPDNWKVIKNLTFSTICV